MHVRAILNREQIGYSVVGCLFSENTMNEEH